MKNELNFVIYWKIPTLIRLQVKIYIIEYLSKVLLACIGINNFQLMIETDWNSCQSMLIGCQTNLVAILIAVHAVLCTVQGK